MLCLSWGLVLHFYLFLLWLSYWLCTPNLLHIIDRELSFFCRINLVAQTHRSGVLHVTCLLKVTHLCLLIWSKVKGLGRRVVVNAADEL